MLSNLAFVFSFEGVDQHWRDWVHESRLIKLSSWLKTLVVKLTGGSTAKIGSLLQMLGYLVALLLFACLGLPSFANDKEGLAIVAAFGSALWLGGFILGGKERRATSTVDLLVLLYFAINIIATASSHYPLPALRGLAKDFVYIVSYFYLTAVLRDSPARRYWIVGTLVVSALVVSLHGLDQYRTGVAPLATWEDPSVEEKGTRIFSWLGNPNLLAGYLVPIVPMGLGLMISFWAAKKAIFAVPAGICTIVIAVATILTGSRGGYIGLFAAIFSVLAIVIAKVWMKNRKLRPFIIIACLVLPLVLAIGLHFVPSFEQRIASIFVGREHSSNSFRMNVWIASLHMFRDNWWIGVGPGNQAFRLAYGLYMRSGFDALGTYCVPLEVAVECGIFGLIVFFVLLVSLLSRGHLTFWSADTSDRWLTAGAVAALIGLTAHGMVDTVFYRPQVQFIFWLAVALITVGKSTAVHSPCASLSD